ncbi:MAG: TolC family protein [Phycisphaerales bacterium]|nr:MAG: TolC family protein [Phycisphaerales bacterium]
MTDTYNNCSLWVALACTALCLSGCANPGNGGDFNTAGIPAERLHEIETMQLAEHSLSEPVSVEQAARNVIDPAVTEKETAESIELELAQVRAHALANNLDLKVELVNPSIAEESVTEEEAVFEPLLFGSIQADRTDRPSAVLDVSGQHSRLLSYDAGVSIPLRAGGTITVDFPFSKSDDGTVDDLSYEQRAKIINPVYETGLKFSISQPLLRDAGVRTNTHPIRVAQHLKGVADARTKLEAIRILANVDRAYWLLFAARRQLQVSQEQYELALQQLEQARRRVAAGAAPEIEIMRAESGVARRLEAIIIADTEVRRRERALKRMMNRDDLPVNSPTSLYMKTEPNPIGLKLDAEALADFAVENRMEMLELELRLAIDSSTIDFERNGALPLFVLDYSYSVNGLGSSFNEAFRDLTDGSFADYSVGLRAEIPVGNQAAKSRVRRALLERLQRLATRDQRRLAIRQEVYDAIDRLEQNWQRILAARQEVILAGRTYEAEKRQFEVGLRTSTEVLEAAARIAGAQSREIHALAAYEISQIDIAYACGTLLGQEGVIWQPTRLD